MYSRYGDNAQRSVRLPEHYGGSAFLQQPTEAVKVPKREPPKPLPREGIGEKASPVADRLLRSENLEAEIPESTTFEESPEPQLPNEECNSLPSDEKTNPAPAFHFDTLRRLFGGEKGEDRDRLLLLGLILLLSRSEGESDILLWLSLLLLCG